MKNSFSLNHLACAIIAFFALSSVEVTCAQRGGRGDRGQDGGGRRGFDPSSFLNRLDKNGNGSIDPEEQEGPAKFFLERMARNNPKIDLSKPIKLSKISEEFQRMRGGGGGDSASNEGIGSESSGPKPLVMGFGLDEPLPAVPGFGAEAEFFAVTVTEADTKLATDRMRRYDRNRDGSLDAEELRRGRFDNNPLQFDRNGDNRLSISELSVRYAKRRENSQENPEGGPGSRLAREQDQRNEDRNRWNRNGNRNVSQQKNKKKEGPWKDRASYRVTRIRGAGASIEGLPSWFSRDDRDANGQISMNEYASTWNDELIEEFFRFDSNQDGLITSDEALRAVENGIVRGGGNSSGAGSRSSSRLSSSSVAVQKSSSGNSGASVGEKAKSGAFSRDGLPAGADDRWVNWCERKMRKMDEDKNGFVTVKEWSKSDGKFDDADANSDGKISLAEYYIFRKN